MPALARECGQAATALLLSRADAETSLGRNDKAIEWYEKILAFNPAQRDALAGLALSALRAGNTPLALEASERLLGAAPQNADAYAVSYLSSIGWTLTTIADMRTRAIVSFASNEKQLVVQRGTLEP